MTAFWENRADGRGRVEEKSRDQQVFSGLGAGCEGLCEGWISGRLKRLLLRELLWACRE